MGWRTWHCQVAAWSRLYPDPPMPPSFELPRLSWARAPLSRETLVVNEWGEEVFSTIPCERALTVYVDKRELVTLMTLGAYPELLVLGFLRNQRLVTCAEDVESITVDWEVGAAAVKTRKGIDQIEQRTARHVVTTGCGQGSIFGGLMDELDRIELPTASLSQSQLYGIVNAIRGQESLYRRAGSVHGCALFRGDEMLVFIEDVGRHNAIDSIAGWMSMKRLDGADKVIYTTGRLTSEMIIKTAQMGIAITVSRSGITEMGLELAQRLGLCAIGRATNKRFLCYSAFERLQLQSELAGTGLIAALPGH
jgi:FdhD protein